MAVVYNGKTQEYDPIVKSGTSYIKTRELVEETLGGEIKWDNKNKEVTVILDGKTLVFTADSNTYYFGGTQKNGQKPRSILR